MREAEAAAGFASPDDLGAQSLMRTALMALRCALEIKDWQVAAEAVVMLEEAAAQNREAYLEEIAHFHGGGSQARLVPLS